MSGSVNLSYTDLTLVGRNGLNFDLTRTYSSSNSMLVYQLNDHPYHAWEKLGTGWQFEFTHFHFDTWDYNNSTGTMYIPSKGSFSIDKYRLQDTAYLGDVTFANSITQIDGGDWASFTLKYNDTGKTDYFDREGNILQTSDSYGNFIRFVYDDKNLSVQKIYNNIGNSINFTYSSSTVVATMGDQTVTYITTSDSPAPDATAKNLAQVIDPAGRVTTYDYAIKKGSIFFCLCNQTSWILTGITHPTGAKTLYTWEQNPVVRSTQTAVFRIASAEQQVKYTDGTIDAFNHINVTYYGDMMTAPAPDQSYPNLPNGVTKFDFSTTIDNGRTQTTYKYLHYALYGDLRFYNTSIKQTNGDTSKTTDMKYDKILLYASPTATTTTTVQTGKPAYSTWATKTYDSNANPLTENYEVGGNTVYTYDSNPTRLSSVQESIDATNTRTTKFQYNTQYKPNSKQVLNSAGQVLASESYTYDTYGNQTEINTNDGTRNIQKKVEYGSAYNYAFPTKTSSQVTDANGTVTTVSNTFEYNPVLGTTTKTTDGKGGVTTYSYDLLGRAVKETYPDLSSKSVKYDDLRNRIELTDELGQKSYSSFNPLGLAMEKGLILQGIDAPKEKHHYDKWGRQDWSQDALQVRTNYAYDAFDRPTTTTFADGSVRSVQYDDSANTVTKTDEDGLSIRETMDKKNRTIKTEQLLVPNPVTLSVTTYDSQDHVLTAQDANQNKTSYTYDLLGQLTSVTDPEGKTTNYVYNKLGKQTQTLYPDGQSALIEYDELGRTIKKTDPLGQLETFFYDANNNVTQKVDHNQQQLTFTYDLRNRLLDKSVETNKISYQYDLFGHRTKMTVGSDVTSYAYNAEGLLQKETLPDSRYITYTYNANGARTQMRDPFGKEIFYTLDNKNQLTSLSTDTETSTPEIRYTYTKTGLTQSLTQRNGIATELTYDSAANLHGLKVKQSNGTVAKSATYYYDKNHNQLTRTEIYGQTDIFSYDSLNRILTSSAAHETYSYDARGNRQTVQSDNMPPPNLNTYEYDVWNQLSKVTTLDGKVVTYRYDGDGLLTERSENGATIRYYYDGDQMIAEATVANGVATLTARYLRGANNQLVAREDATGKKAYYTHNGHGDVTELRDSAGTVLNRYTYDIWGTPLTTQETVSNPFRYSGELLDTTSKLQYLRARWYDPQQGRFLNEDTNLGDINNPKTLNLYTYVENNPITLTDPTGHFPMPSWLGPLLVGIAVHNIVTNKFINSHVTETATNRVRANQGVPQVAPYNTSGRYDLGLWNASFSVFEIAEIKPMTYAPGTAKYMEGKYQLERYIYSMSVAYGDGGKKKFVPMTSWNPNGMVLDYSETQEIHVRTFLEAPGMIYYELLDKKRQSGTQGAEATQPSVIPIPPDIIYEDALANLQIKYPELRIPIPRVVVFP